MPRAIQFRYFWLEILSSAQAVAKLSELVDITEVRNLRDTARGAYIVYVAGEKEKALRTSAPNLSESTRKEQAKKDAEKEVRQALIRWFDFSASEMDTWLQASGKSAVLAAEEEQALEEDLEELDGDEEADMENDVLSEPQLPEA